MTTTVAVPTELTHPAAEDAVTEYVPPAALVTEEIILFWNVAV